MTPYYQDDHVTIYHGDNAQALPAKELDQTRYLVGCRYHL